MADNGIDPQTSQFATGEAATVVVSDDTLEQTTVAGGQSQYHASYTPRPVHLELMGMAQGFEVTSQVLGQGGIGTVYLGRQTALDRDVAIKVQRDGNSGRFLAEALVPALLTHPNIIPVYRIFNWQQLFAEPNQELSDTSAQKNAQSGPKTAFAMKLLKGKTLEQWLNDERPENGEQSDIKDFADFLNRFLNILKPICNALDFAHSQKIIHCDIKPDNIHVGQFNEVLVFDWGCAVDCMKPSERPDPRTNFHTEVQWPLGTPDYWSPELKNGQGEKIGPATDVYLVGGLLYRALAGAAPHSAHTRLPPQFFKHFQDICANALQADPKLRYASCRDLYHACVLAQQRTKSDQFVELSRQRFVRPVQSEMAKLDQTAAQIQLFEACLSDLEFAASSWPENPEIERLKPEIHSAFAKYAIEHKLLPEAQRQISELDPKLDSTLELEEQLVRLQYELTNESTKRWRLTRVGPLVLLVSVACIIALMQFDNSLSHDNELQQNTSYINYLISQEHQIHAADENCVELAERWLKEANESLKPVANYQHEFEILKAQADGFRTVHTEQSKRRELILRVIEETQIAIVPRFEKLRSEFNRPGLERRYLFAINLCQELSSALFHLHLIKSQFPGEFQFESSFFNALDPINAARDSGRRIDDFYVLDHYKAGKTPNKDIRKLTDQFWNSVKAALDAEQQLRLGLKVSKSRLIQLFDREKYSPLQRAKLSEPSKQLRANLLQDYLQVAHRLSQTEIPKILARVAHSKRIKAQSLSDLPMWQKLNSDLQSDKKYQGLQIRPIYGISPLGKNPTTGLWEFIHLPSGDKPASFPTKELQENCGIILVLIPPQSFTMGAIQTTGSHHIPEEFPSHEVKLDAFLIGKYEVTQAQWSKVAKNPSYTATIPMTRHTYMRSPVDYMDWKSAMTVAARWNLQLPTEAQWECATRAGTQTPFWWGSDVDKFETHENIYDQSFVLWTGASSNRYDDHYPLTSPAGTFKPNPYGLYDTLGNVSEMVRDEYASLYNKVLQKNGLRLTSSTKMIVCKGGCLRQAPNQSTAFFRLGQAKTFTNYAVGARFSLDLVSPNVSTSSLSSHDLQQR